VTQLNVTSLPNYLTLKENTLPLLLETIKVEGYKALNLHYHQKRLNKSQKALFGLAPGIDLASLIDAPSEALYRCRILYDTEIRSIEYLPYTPKKIHTLKIVSATLDYTYKYADRAALNVLLETHSQYDDILIEKEGLLTDTSIANIAFYDGHQWFTPKDPLLEGTMRAKLLDEGFLQTKEIQRDDLSSYTQVALMNAMIGFKIIDLHIE